MVLGANTNFIGKFVFISKFFFGGGIEKLASYSRGACS